MRFTRPLIRLPVRFSAATLASETAGLPRSAWVPHPNKFPGNDAVRLITPDGQATDTLEGSMAATEHLRACPYILELMANLGGTWGRSRLMGLAAGAEVPPHVDSHYYWRTHLRIHIPIITNPGVAFTCGGETVHMAPGECWIFDSFQRHEVHNRGTDHRVHLVLDTVGGRRLWELIEQAQSDQRPEPQLLDPGRGGRAPLLFERINSPQVMSPWEMRCHIRFLEDEAQPHVLLDTVMNLLDRLVHEWGALWASYETSSTGVPLYRQLLNEAGRDLGALGGQAILLKNDLSLYHVLARLVFEVALASEPEPASGSAPVARRIA